MSEKHNHLFNETEPSVGKEFIGFLIEHSKVECPDVNVDVAWNDIRKKIASPKHSYSWLKIAVVAVVAVASVLYVKSTFPALRTVASLEEKTSVRLPDGSIAVLNENSSFTFPEFFGHKRRVSFKGEGYFDIKKSTKPFIIDAGTVEVKVLGTAFNLITSDDKTYLFVDRGLVAFVKDGKETKVKAGSEAIFNAKDNSVTFVEPPSPNIMSWRNGLFIFNDIPLSESLNQLEDYYDVTFELDNKKLGSCKVTATFEKQSLKEVFDTFASILHITIEKKGEVVKFSGKGC